MSVATLAGNDDSRGVCLPGYPGNKSSEGVWQTIINNIPPHDVWIEAFAGSAVITRRKRPAQSSIVIDSDAAVCGELRQAMRRLTKNPATLVEQFGLTAVGESETIIGSVRVIEGDAVKWLSKNRGMFNARTVVYCDPPYLDETLAVPGRSYYREDFGHVDEHTALLRVLRALRCPVLLSGYQSHLYDGLLATWRRVDYQTATHGGVRTESLWCNFPEPDALHDWRYLGRNFRERERIKRKLARWRARLAAMPVLERRLIAAALADRKL